MVWSDTKHSSEKLVKARQTDQTGDKAWLLFSDDVGQNIPRIEWSLNPWIRFERYNLYLQIVFQATYILVFSLWD